jgi:predicted Rossmann-fold nucleotide-binding protein
MEAASRGAREAGGRVFGIVMNQFKSEPNRLSHRQGRNESLL